MVAETAQNCNDKQKALRDKIKRLTGNKNNKKKYKYLFAAISGKLTGNRENNGVLQLAITVNDSASPIYNESFMQEKKSYIEDTENLIDITPGTVHDCNPFTGHVDLIRELLVETGTIVTYNSNEEISLLEKYGLSFQEHRIINLQDIFSSLHGTIAKDSEDGMPESISLNACASHYSPGKKFDFNDAFQNCKAICFCLRKMIDNGDFEIGLLLYNMLKKGKKLPQSPKGRRKIATESIQNRKQTSL